MTLANQRARLLLAILAERIETKELEKRIGNSDSSDWQELCKLVFNHGIFSLFYGRLLALKPKGRACDFLHRLKDAYLLNLQRNLFYEQELLKIISHLQKYDIAVIALKGPILARLFYQDVALRQAPADLDLLVKKEDLPKAQSVLEEIGYGLLQLEPKKDFLQPAGLNHQITQICLTNKTHGVLKFTLDIHTCLRGFFRQEQIQALWQQARYLNVAGADVLVLSNEDLLLYLSIISISLFESVQLRYLYDIHMLVTACKKDMDWDRLLDKAKDYNLNTCLYFPLALCRSLFRTEIPDNVLGATACSWLPKKLINLWIDKEQLLSHPDGFRFGLIARLILCRYLYSSGWGDFLNKLFIRSFRGGKNERYNSSQKEPGYSQPYNRRRDNSYAALQDVR